MLKNKTILIGVTGSVAIYRTIDLVRRLQQAGSSVNIIMTRSAMEFVNPLLFETVSGGKVYLDTFKSPLSHIELVQESDIFVVAPATANIIGKFASGIADDLLSTVHLGIKPENVLIAPSMNWRMYSNPLVQRNLEILKGMGVNIIGPESGALLCGEEGTGRMSEIDDIIIEIERLITPHDLEGINLMVTAGPTREYIDPVRFLTNRSSGKMGYAIARNAYIRGANVTLISGPVALRRLYGVKTVYVETTEEMMDAVFKNISFQDIIIMAGAPADFTFETSQEKLKKDEEQIITLKKTPDIILEVKRRFPEIFAVGFSAETSYELGRARKKMLEKNLDMIVFNNVLEKGAGFDVDTNRVTIIDPEGEIPLDIMPKEDVASYIIDRVVKLISGRNLNRNNVDKEER